MAKALLLVSFLIFSASAQADDLTIYVYPSPMGLDWSTPRALGWSVTWNELFDDNDELINIHTIGHMNFDLNCGVSEESTTPIRIFTGQTNTDDQEMSDDILENGYGVGAMLTNYSGRWETQAEIEHDLPIRYRAGTVQYMHFKIQPSTCARVALYLHQYQQRGFDKIYGGLQDVPRKGQGAGCAAFTAGVLEIAGLMSPELKSYWSHSVNIPNKVIGGPITGNDVDFGEILFGSIGASWAPSATNAYPLTFWDPNYAWWWITYANKGPVGLTGMTYTPSKRGKSLGVEIDASMVPTPTAPIWQTP